jgi:hypothetical protein
MILDINEEEREFLFRMVAKATMLAQMNLLPSESMIDDVRKSRALLAKLKVECDDS